MSTEVGKIIHSRCNVLSRQCVFRSEMYISKEDKSKGEEGERRGGCVVYNSRLK
jgi:hypothetical protein